MKGQAAQVRVAGSLSKSADVMKAMHQLIRVPEIQKTMQEMSKEMMKAGIIEEMMEDVMEPLGEQDELEDAAQEEVDKILFELTAGKLGDAPEAVKDTLPALPTPAKAEPEEEEDDGELEDMQSRLEALRS